MPHRAQRRKSTRYPNGIRHGIAQAGIQERSKARKRAIKMVRPVNRAAPAAQSLFGTAGGRARSDGGSIIQSLIRRPKRHSQVDVSYARICFAGCCSAGRTGRGAGEAGKVNRQATINAKVLVEIVANGRIQLYYFVRRIQRALNAFNLGESLVKAGS